MTRRHAIINPAALGTGLVIERAGLVLTHEAATNLNRKALSTDPKQAGRWGAEWYVWGDGTVANSVSLGIARPTSSLSVAVGADDESYGYRLGEGQIHHDGASIETVTVGGTGQIIGIELDLTVPGLPAVGWLLDDVLLAQVALPDDGPWCLAATVCGTDAAGLRVLQNTGQRAFTYLSGAGLYAERESLGAIRLSTRAFVTPGDADDPHVRYRGLLSSDSRLQLRQRLTFWPMGDASGTGGGGGTLRLDNADGALDHMIGVAARGALVRVRRIPDGGSIDDAEDVGTLTVDYARPASDGVLDVRLVDPETVLESALQRALLPPDADPTTADTVMPVSLGAARSVEPKILDGPSLTYLMHDGPISALGNVRDGGYPLDPEPGPDPETEPPDYQLDARGRLVLERDPFYRITADIGVDGSSYTPPVSGDILEGDGDPFAGTPGNAPTGWSRGTYGSSPDTPPSYIGSGQVSFPNHNTGANSYLLHDDALTVPGEMYRVTLTIHSALKPDLFAPASYVAVSRSLSDFDALLLAEINEYSTFPKTFVATFIASHAHPIYVTHRPVQLTTGAVVISECTVTLVQRLDVTDDDDIPALKLEPMLRELLCVRGGLAEDQWVAADAAAIDAETGYAGTGLHVAEPIPLGAAIQSVLDSYGACLWRDAQGRIRVARMRRPLESDAVGTITRARMLGDIRPREYEAPNFTTQARGRRNWRPLVEGQMSTDTEDIPPSLRARLTAEYRIGVASGANVAPAYAHGVYAEPHNSLLDQRADLQAECDRITEIHAEVMSFWGVDVEWSSEYAPDQVWLIDYTDRRTGKTRYGLDGKPCVIVGMDADPIAETLTLTLLG